MQNLNFKDCQNLNSALNASDIVESGRENVAKQVLKSGKHLSTDSYLKVMTIKKKLRDLFEDLSTKEKPAFEDNGYQLIGNEWSLPELDKNDKEYTKKLNEQRATGKKVSDMIDAIRKGNGYEVRKESRGKDKSKAVVKKLPIDGAPDDTLIQIPEPFIKKEEFLEWTKECSNEAASILAEFLLVGFDKE